MINLLNPGNPTPRWKCVYDLIRKEGYGKIAEIGVEGGTSFATKIINSFNLDVYIMVERHVEKRLYEAIEGTDVSVRLSDGWGTAKPVVLMRMSSAQAAPYIADGTLDLIFIDAGHGYPNCLEDIAIWKPKIRKGGIICGHDYFPDDGYFERVSKAVKESFDDFNIVVEEPRSPLGGNHVWWTYV